MEKNNQSIIPITLALFAIGTVIFACMGRWDALTLSLDPTKVGSLLAPLTLAAGFVERAVEVIISPWRDKDADQLKKVSDTTSKMAGLSSSLADVHTAAAALAPDQPRVLDQAQQSVTAANVAASNAAVANDDLIQYKGKTKQYAYALSLFLSFFVAYVGVRALANLLDPKATFGTHQRLMFNTVDVIVTAAMLAGGANGIHSVVTAFTSFFDNSAKKSQDA